MNIFSNAVEVPMLKVRSNFMSIFKIYLIEKLQKFPFIIRKSVIINQQIYWTIKFALNFW